MEPWLGGMVLIMPGEWIWYHFRRKDETYGYVRGWEHERGEGSGRVRTLPIAGGRASTCRSVGSTLWNTNEALEEGLEDRNHNLPSPRNPWFPPWI